MADFEFSIIINQPVERVFAYVDRPENYPEWQAGVIDGGGDPDGKVGVGSKGWQIRKMFGRKMKMTFEITKYEHNQCKCFSSTSGPTKLEGCYTVKSVEEGTLFISKFTSTPQGFVKLIEPLINRKVKTQWHTTLARLKH